MLDQLLIHQVRRRLEASGLPLAVELWNGQQVGQEALPIPLQINKLCLGTMLSDSQTRFGRFPSCKNAAQRGINFMRREGRRAPAEHGQVSAGCLNFCADPTPDLPVRQGLPSAPDGW